MRGVAFVTGFLGAGAAIGAVSPTTARADDVAATATASRPELQADVGLSILGLDYEQPLSQHLALAVGGGIVSTYFAPWFDSGDRVDGYAAELRASWFPRGGQRGLYVTPFVRVARLTASDVEGVGVGVSGGVFAGWAWALPHRLDVRAGVGVQYYDYQVHDTGMSTPFFGLDGVIAYRL